MRSRAKRAKRAKCAKRAKPRAKPRERRTQGARSAREARARRARAGARARRARPRGTIREVAEGWVSEPIDPVDLPWDAIVNKRFAIMQGERPRVIDDCSASLLNDSVQKTESPKPQSTDLVSSLCLYMLTVLPGLAMLGKCFDLKAAYRQVPISLNSLKSGRACVVRLCPWS